MAPEPGPWPLLCERHLPPLGARMCAACLVEAMLDRDSPSRAFLARTLRDELGDVEIVHFEAREEVLDRSVWVKWVLRTRHGTMELTVGQRHIEGYSGAQFVRSFVETVRKELDARREAEAKRDIGPSGWNDVVPDLTETVVGFREWSIDEQGNLGAVGSGNGHMWRGGAWAKATCNMGQHPAPGENCHCGFNAYHEPPGAAHLRSISAARLSGYYALCHTSIRVWGAIAARGSLMVHGDGFRAEFARPVLLAYAETPEERGRDFHEELRRAGGMTLEEFVDRHVMGPPPVPRPRPRSEHEDFVRRLGRLHGIEVVPLSKLARRACDFGTPVPAELRPQHEPRRRRLR